MKRILRYVKYRLLEWRWDRILAKSGCRSWYQYIRRNDPDFDYSGETLEERFCGYPFIVIVNPCYYSEVHDIVSYIHHPKLEEWCRENCVGKYRFEVANTFYVGSTMCTVDYDDLVVGFQNENDHIMYLLRWG